MENECCLHKSYAEQTTKSSNGNTLDLTTTKSQDTLPVNLISATYSHTHTFAYLISQMVWP